MLWAAELLLFLAQDAASPHGWRRDGSGVFPGATPPLEWSEKKNVAWRTEVGGGHSSPVIAGDRVFVLAEPGTLWCLDRAKGTVLWKAAVGEGLPEEVKKKTRGLPPGLKDQARATPVTDGEHVWVALTTGVVSCYTVKGARAWAIYADPAPLSYGPGASLVLSGKTLLVDSTRLQAHEASSGNFLWKAAAAEPHYGTPALLTLDGTPLALTAKGAVVRLSDGAVLARDVAAGLGGEQAATPLIDGDTAYFAYHRCSAVKLSLKDGKVRAEKLWEQELPGDVIASPVLKDGLLYVMPSGTSDFRVLESRTGKILVEKDLGLGPNYYPSLALAGGRVFLGNDKGYMLVLEPGPAYKELHRNELPEGSAASPLFQGAHAFLRDGEHLYCIGP